MHNVRKIFDDLYYIGGSDRRLSLFENVYPIPTGVTYNSYLLLDEKTVLIDTVDRSVFDIFKENLVHALNGRGLDYVIINHMEPDHVASLADVVGMYPEVKVIINKKMLAMIKNFFTFDIESRAVIVGEMDTVCFGKHTFAFVMAPMVHWPETMVSYDKLDKTLFSGDAFGTFGADTSNIFADEIDFDRDYLAEARRYYTNIVGKYGTQVNSLLKKAGAIEIKTICPLHGFIWRKNINYIVEKYTRWASYVPEDKSVMIAYASVYGNTENTAMILASKLSDMGISNVKIYDVSVTDSSYLIAEAFRVSHIVLASTTYNAGIFVKMENFITDLVDHNLQNRNFAIIENGSWASTAGSLMIGHLSKLKNTNFIGEKFKITSSLKADQLNELDELASLIKNQVMPVKETVVLEKIDNNAMFKLSYGLFLLSTELNGFQNGCIINTVTQITDSKKRISIAVNKANHTHDMLLKSKKFNISILTTETPFSVFEQYGFSSGRDADKFKGATNIAQMENGINYLNEYTNAVLSGEVTDTINFDTHTLFIAEITEAKTLTSQKSVTYDYYFANIKPKPAVSSGQAKGFVCKICAFVYEGENLPSDYICPLCKHGVSDFEKL